MRIEDNSISKNLVIKNLLLFLNSHYSVLLLVTCLIMLRLILLKMNKSINFEINGLFLPMSKLIDKNALR